MSLEAGHWRRCNTKWAGTRNTNTTGNAIAKMVGLSVSTSAAERSPKLPHSSLKWLARQTTMCARQNALRVQQSRLRTPPWRNSTSLLSFWCERHLWRQDTTNTIVVSGGSVVSSAPLLTEAIVVPTVEGMRELLNRVAKHDTAMPVSRNIWEKQGRIDRMRTPCTKRPRTERRQPGNIFVVRVVAC